MRLIARSTLAVAEALSRVSNMVERVITGIISFSGVIMKPEEIMQYTRKAYEKGVAFYGMYTHEDYVKKGLVEWERAVFEEHALNRGSVLVLGSGGGREAIALARLGYRVIGLDFSPIMVKAAKKFAADWGVDADFRVGDFMHLGHYSESFDYCLLSCVLYSLVPTGRLRIDMLKNIRLLLNPGGKIFIHFAFDGSRESERLLPLRRFAAKALHGNVEYSIGDSFIPPFHFIRTFHDEKEIADEAMAAGLDIRSIVCSSQGDSYAVLEKSHS